MKKFPHRARKVTDLPSIYLTAGRYFLGLKIDKWRRCDEMSISYQAYSAERLLRLSLLCSSRQKNYSAIFARPGNWRALQTGGQSSSAQPHEVATPTLQMIDPRSHKMSGPYFVMLSYNIGF
jgi:hypothetical protein